MYRECLRRWECQTNTLHSVGSLVCRRRHPKNARCPHNRWHTCLGQLWSRLWIRLGHISLFHLQKQDSINTWTPAFQCVQTSLSGLNALTGQNWLFYLLTHTKISETQMLQSFTTNPSDVIMIILCYVIIISSFHTIRTLITEQKESPHKTMCNCFLLSIFEGQLSL